MTALPLADIEISRSPHDRLYRRITLRIVPFLLLCYVVSFLDRINIGFAHLQMGRDIGISDAAYGLGAGMFFLGYVIFEVPSNLFLMRLGARRTFCRIMIGWGVVSACTMFVQSAWQFNILRFLLGSFEAGFFPGIVLYLTHWFPAQRRATVVSWFFVGAALAGMFGGPLSGAIMHGFAGVSGMRGWQWLFLLEGLPAVGLGIASRFVLVDGLEQVSWLSTDEKTVLRTALVREQEQKQGTAAFSLAQACRDPKLYWCAFMYFALACGSYAVSLWLPVLIRDSGVKDVLSIGMFSAIPYGLGAIAIVLISRNSDRMSERRIHFAVCSVVSAAALAGLAAYGVTAGIPGMITLLTVAIACIYGAIPIFWSIPPTFLSGRGAASGIAIISSIGSLGGFASPYVMGLISVHTGRLEDGLYVMAMIMVACALSVFAIPPVPTGAVVVS